ncbi:MAG: RNA polymerase sigma factor [Spirochaetota bacterium]|nr:RNA polymerase sigma factor [Spirochaetota bacterium]
MSYDKDLDIIDKVLSGDVDHFSAIIEKYRNMVFRYAFSRVGHYEEALDITQDIFLMTFEALNSFRRESKFSTWLYSIMVNYCINYKKRRDRYSFISLNRENGDNEFELQLRDEKYNLEEEVVNSDSLRIIMDELYELPDDYKDILILRDVEGLSYNEIADILKINLSNVKVRIHRGRSLLKKRIFERGLL